ncbi:hypothetical protein BK005_00265 [bacterium CG10_37_50]|nr:MAG: hypothetical protein BK005_00265 [bacterium CG10_37_50]
MATGLENLKVYTMACELELRVFELTKDFPKDEKYRSVDQLRRSSSSVSNNIAESYNRRHLKEKIRILHDIVKSEAEETKRNLEMCQKKDFYHDQKIIDRYTELLKIISGYIRFVRQSELKNLQTIKLTN